MVIFVKRKIALFFFWKTNFLGFFLKKLIKMAKKRSSLKHNRPNKDGVKPQPGKFKRSKSGGTAVAASGRSNHSLNPGKIFFFG